MRVRAPRIDPEWRVQPGQGPRLVHLLRSARLSLLYGPAGSGKTSLLRTQVLPSLARRLGDLPPAPQRPSRIVVPLVERRARGGGPSAGEGVELPVYFDSWGTDPLVALRRGIDAAAAWLAPDVLPRTLPGLAEPLAAAAQRHGLRFLIVLDGFERHLDQPSHRAGIAAFDEALIEAVNRPFLPLHVLIAMREQAEPRLSAYRARIARFDDHSLRLDGAGVAMSPLSSRGAGPTSVPPPPTASTVEIADREADARAAPDAWLASLDSIVLRVAEAGRDEGKPPTGVVLPELRDMLPTAPPPEAQHPTRPVEPVAARAVAGRQKPLSPAAWSAAGVAGLIILALAWPHAPPGTAVEPARLVETTGRLPLPPGGRPPLPSPAPAARPLPRLDMAFDGDGAQERIVQDLAEIVAPAAGIALDLLPAGLRRQGMPSGPAVGIARYDALQAAAGRVPASDGPPIRVIAPLVVEPIGFVVREDSPLHTIDQLKGRRINAGPADGGRALTAAAIYERSFGTRLPAAAARELDELAALRELRDGTGRLDAVLTLGHVPEPGSGLRLLRLDLDQPSTRKLLQSYLPATLGSTPTLGVMSFLVAPRPTDAATRMRLADLAGALCRTLPSLQRHGDARWQQLRPGLDLDAGWPALPEAQAAWRDCAPAR